MVLRICEFLISSWNASPAGTNGLTAATAFVASATACAGVATADGEKFSTSDFTILPFSPEPFT